jgi:hypothetical protein
MHEGESKLVAHDDLGVVVAELLGIPVLISPLNMLK